MESKFKEVLDRLGGVLRSNHFKKNRTTFSLQKENNLAFVNFQRSRSNGYGVTQFTINIGIFSTAIASYLPSSVFKKPDVWDCHVQKRIGYFSDHNKDFWWTLDGQSNIGEVLDELNPLLVDRAIPFLVENLSDEALFRKWSAGICHGIGEYQRLLYLTILAKHMNRPEAPEIISQLLDYEQRKDVHTWGTFLKKRKVL